MALGRAFATVPATVLHDLRYAVRGLVRTPAFTAGAVLTLALGIGANSTIFTLANAMLFRPMAAIRLPSELVWISGLWRDTNRTTGALPLARVLGALIFGVRVADLAAFAGTCALLVGVALLAALLPARRAARVDPMTALRAE